MDKQLFNLLKTPGESERFIKRSTQFYLSVFKANRLGTLFPSWNWVCFFAAFTGLEAIWFFYRRAYFYGVVIGLVGAGLYGYLSLQMAVTLSAKHGYIIGVSTMYILKWLWIFPFTIYGNALYGKHLDTQMKQGKTQGGTDPYTPLVAFFLLKVMAAYAILKLTGGEMDPSNMKEIITQLMNRHEN